MAWRMPDEGREQHRSPLEVARLAAERRRQAGLLAQRRRQMRRDVSSSAAAAAERARRAEKARREALAKEREKLAADARAEAYDQLQVNAAKRRALVAAALKAREGSEYDRIVKELQAVVFVDPLTGRKVTVGDKQAAADLAEARKTGNFAPVFRGVRDRQRQTGGRYIDVGSYNRIYEGWDEQVKEADRIQASWQGRFDKLAKDGKVHKIYELMKSDAFKRDEAWLIRYGKQVPKIGRLTGEIKGSNDAYMAHASLGLNAPGKSEEQLAILDELVQKHGASGQTVVGGKTVDEYYRMIDEQVRARYRATYAGWLFRQRMLAQEGLQERQLPGGGKVIVDLGQEAFAKRLQTALESSGHDPKQVLQEFESGSSTEKDRAFWTMEQSMTDEILADLDKRYPDLPRSIYSGDPRKADYGREREARIKAMRTQLYHQFYGPDATPSEGLAKGLEELPRVPGLGFGLKALGIPWAGVGMAIRAISDATMHGRPFADIAPQAPGTRKDAYGNVIQVSPERQAQDAERYRAWLAAGGQAGQANREVLSERDAWHDWDRVLKSGDLAQIEDKILNMGFEWSQNPYVNLGSSLIFDPVNYMSPVKWLGAGRAAVAATGGVRQAIRSPAEFGRVVALARTFSKDKSLYRTALRRSGYDVRFGPGTSDRVIADARMEDLFTGGEKALDAEAGRLAQLWKRPEPEAKQILIAAMDAVEQHALGRGISIPGVAEVPELRKDAERLVRRGEQRIAAERVEVRAAGHADTGRAEVGRQRAATLKGPLAAEGKRLSKAKAAEQAERNALRARLGVKPKQSFESRMGELRRERAAKRPAVVAEAKKVQEAQRVLNEARAMGRDTPAMVAALDAAKADFATVLKAAEGIEGRALHLEGDALRQAVARRKAVEESVAGLRTRRGDVGGVTPTRDVTHAVSKHEKELAAYDKLRVEAAEHSKVLGSADATDLERQAAYRGLKDVLARSRKYEDTAVPIGPPSLGRISQARAYLDETRRAAGLRDVRGATRIESRVPIAQIDAELAAVARELPVARAAGDVRRVRELGATARFLRRERLRTGGRAAIADETVKRFGNQAVGQVRANRFVAKVRSIGEAMTEGLRDLNVRYHETPRTGAAATLTPAEVADLAKVRGDLAHRPVDWSDPRLAPLEPTFAGRDLLDTFEALSVVKGDVVYRDALYALRRQIESYRDPDAILDLISREHYGTTPDWEDFARIDQELVARKAARDDPRRSGVLESRGPARQRDPMADIGTLRNTDSSIELILDKIDVARAHGTTLAGYNELRPLLSGPMLKVNTSQSVFREAEALAAATGRTFDDAYGEVHQARVRREAREMLWRDAYEYADSGAAPEELYRSFADRNSFGDLLEVEPRAGINSWQADRLRDVMKKGGFDPENLAEVEAALGRNMDWGSEAAVKQALVESGFWTKRTGEDIKSGGRVWDVDTEREFFRTHFGVEPQWTDPAVIEAAFATKEAFAAYTKAGGYTDDLFEAKALGKKVQQGRLKEKVAFGGGEGIGIRKGRTPQEVRSYLAARFGSIVSDDGGKTLKTAHWLMDPTKPEFERWMVSEAARQFGMKGMSPTLAKDLIRRGEVVLPPSYLKPEQVHDFTRVMGSTVSRHLEQAIKGDGLDIIMPERQFRIALDVLDELLATKSWRAWSRGEHGLSEIANAAMWAQRMTVMFSGAFAVLNPVERLFFRGPLSQLRYTDVNFTRRLSQRAMELFGDGDLAAINIGSTGMFENRSMSGWSKFRNPVLEANARGMGLVQAIAEVPSQISAIGEMSMMSHMAGVIYDDFYDSFIKGGMSHELAHVEALHEARSRVIELFALSDGAGTIEKAFNSLIPFFSYNFRTAKLWLGIAASHPSVIALGDRLGNFVEELNREEWEKKYGPDIPMPEGGAREFKIKLGDHEYSVDLSQYSDVLRAASKVTGSRAPDTVPGWIGNFFRVPHPLQLGLYAALTGQDAPWGGGSPGLRDYFWPEDLVQSINEVGDGKEYADMIEMFSDLFTWNRWRRQDPVKQLGFAYFAMLRQKRYEAAAQLLRDRPDVELFVRMYRPDSVGNPTGIIHVPYWRGRSQADKDAFSRDMADYRKLQADYEAEMEPYWNQPWSPELAALKKERRAALGLFELQHPDISGVFASGYDRNEWIAKAHDLDVDDATDTFFDLSARFLPKREDFAKGDRGELEYAVAKRRYEAWRKEYLAARPDVEARITYAADDFHRAWREWEADKAARFDIINDLTIRRLREELKPKDEQDRKLINELYEVAGYYWDQQNADGMWTGMSPADKEYLHYGRSDAGRMGFGVMLPGMERLKLARMAPGEREAYKAEQERKMRYGNGMGEVMRKVDAYKGSKDKGAYFYDLLREDPWLMRQYFKRNPGKAAKYQAGQDYYNALGPWARAAKSENWDRAEKLWDALPGWVKDRYYAAHPGVEQRMAQGQAYYAAMGRWVKLFESRDPGAADAFFRKLPDWMKEKYFAKHPDQRFTLGTDLSMQKKLASYFMGDDANRLRYLRENPDVRRYLQRYNSDSERRSMILAYARTLPDAWSRRVYRERFPEMFGDEAAAESRARSLRDKLRKNPGLADAWEKAFAYQTEVYEAQLKLQGTRPPKPLDAVHLREHVRKRRRVRRRAARFSSHWMSHEEARHG